MIFNTALQKTFRKRDRRYWCRVLELLMIYADYMDAHKDLEDPGPNCHAICRGLAKLIPHTRVIDGNFIGLKHVMRKGKMHIKLRFAAHTWLMLPSGSIIDPYPVGFMSTNPVLVVTRGIYKPFGQGAYMPDKSTTKAHVTKEVLGKARELTRLIRKAIRWKTKQK